MRIGKQKAIVWAGLAILLVATAASGCSGDNKAIQAAKAGHFDSYTSMTIGEMLDKGLKDSKWSRAEGPSEGVDFVQVTGVLAEKDDTSALVTLKFKVVAITGLVQPISVFVDGTEESPEMLTQFIERLAHRIGAKPAAGSKLGIENANAAAQTDVKFAYTAAQAYLTNNPNGTLTLSLLEQNGFNKSEGVLVNIVNGHQNSLEITARHENGNETYQVDANGNITAGVEAANNNKPVSTPAPATSEEDSKERNDETCCGTLADIDIKTLKAPDLAAIADLKNAYTIAMAYFANNPKGKLTLPLLTRNGFKKSAGVTVEIVDGSLGDLLLTSVHNEGGTFVYSTGPNGVIGLEPNI